MLLLALGAAALLVINALRWWRGDWFPRWPVIAACFAALAGGGVGVADSRAMQHTHQCHAHHSDGCASGHDVGRHTHLLGGRAAARQGG